MKGTGCMFRPHTLFAQPNKVRLCDWYHPTPNLLVLEKIVSIAKNANVADYDLEHTAIIGVQHILETTASLLESIIQLGINPSNIYICGKCYSTCPEVKNSISNMGINLFDESIPTKLGGYQEACKKDINLMWQQLKIDAPKKKIKKIIILDDGGRCFELMPPCMRFHYEIAGLEQTRGGLYVEELKHLAFPIVEVASSVVKRMLEPPFIAEAVINKVNETMPHFNINKETVCGIVGYGAIGQALAKHLANSGYTVLIYDENIDLLLGAKSSRIFPFESLKTLITNSQCVFGCTGKDISAGLDLLNFINKDTVFISCTSEDKEFLSLLEELDKTNTVQKNNPLKDITYTTKNSSKITIAAGGFPVNFFGLTPWNVPSRHIAITQALLLLGVLQAITSARKAKSNYTNHADRQMLHPVMQSLIVSYWCKSLGKEIYNYFSPQFLKLFENYDWVMKQSKGENVNNNFFNKAIINMSESQCSEPIKLTARL